MNGRDDDIRSLLGAWALDAVDDLERAAVEQAIASDPELAEEARQLRETVSRIAEADAQQPPEHLREAVLDQINETAQSDAGATSTAVSDVRHDKSPPLRRRRRWQALAAAAVVVIAVAIPTAIAVDQADRADQAEQQAQQAQQDADVAQQRADQIAQALTDPGAQMVAEDLPDGSRAVAVLGEDEALFAAHGMTELHAQDYQLWVLHGDEATSAGVLAWQEGRLAGHAEDVPEGAALAVTAEPIGGSDQPTSDPMVVLSP